MAEDNSIKKIMHVMRHAPHGSIYTYEGLEMILIMAAYEQDLSVAFIGDGVYALKKGQETSGIDIKGFAKTFLALEGYDVEKLYVDETSLQERGLTEDDLLVDVEVMSAADIGRLMNEQDVVIPH
ncbi:sulfurtransferase complex subunit TusC [Prosthecochloris sp. N3]|uniref:Sulfurtransferase complex subunit TusC n=1 Tax=Prosthecochloris ethylica TaxID=2743976 RepID=A0ABR9XRU7_9CHLB|nr:MULTISPECIES: sulfurtransferase complex subunit TusC [Prosthecochloris]MEC9487196.1 sulfurtransferase complex subunit TusC [Prosthecochloris sp.]MBF0585993.1 sulfurtransferase complex subunit TusC [Prosthecochloris ethylica]MBF0636607.1 sulfurtransferase complex subunit TusC [Prosthecochloris ethylica]NUK47239.1 sulfurtransferase complex subunit TusC [Prosthecochloris ethylica]RNA64041.1 sulfurtransferase complex subunit TusC [Prosthecochloris sp. ZM_2]